MTPKDILNDVALIHNCLAQINVRGDDAIRMADALNKCRTLVYRLNQAVQDESEREQE